MKKRKLLLYQKKMQRFILSLNKNVKNVEDLVAFADQALYQAKSEGRNRICLHQHLSYMYRPDREPSPSPDQKT